MKENASAERATEDEQEEDGTDALEAQLYYLKQRAYPHDIVDWTAYARAAAHRDKMPTAANLGGASGSDDKAIMGLWDFVGPNNLAVPYQQYYGIGPISGRVNAVAFDPSTPGTYYVSAAGGGFWRTTDNGASWNCLSSGVNSNGNPYWKYQQAGSIAINPTNSNTIYVVGGDTYFFGAFEDRFRGNAIMKTTDGGVTWTSVGSRYFGSNGVSKVVVDPENPNLLTATTGSLDPSAAQQGKIWRSLDGGATWKPAALTSGKPVPSGVWTDVVCSALTAQGVRYYYAVAYNAVTAGASPWLLYRSSNRGVSWQPLSAPSDWGTQAPQVGIDIAPSEVFPSIVYLLSGVNNHVYKSINAGQSWANTTNNFPNGDSQLGSNYNWTQNSYDYDIVCSSRTDSTGQLHDVIYVGEIDLAQSADDGATWRSIGGPTYAQSGALTHNDQHALAVNPANPDELLVGNDGGAYLFTYTPSSGTWSYASLNADLGITQLYKMAESDTVPDTILGGAQDNAGPVAEGDLTSWLNPGGGDSGWCAVRPDNPAIQFMTGTSGANSATVYETTDAWASVRNNINLNVAETAPFLCPLLLDPSYPTHLYAAVRYLYQWDDTARSWSSRLSPALCGSAIGNAVLSLAVSCDGTAIYAGSDTGALTASVDGGATWNVIDTSLLPQAAITAIKVLCPDPHAILVGLGGTGHGHLYYCADVTNPTWQAVSGTPGALTALPDINLNAIEVDPHDPLNTLYVATDAGVFSSTNFGNTWSNASNKLGLPTVQVNDLKADAVNDYLYAATFGRGIWRIDIAPSTKYTVTELSPDYGYWYQVNDCGQVGGTSDNFEALIWLGPSAGSVNLGSIDDEGAWITGINHSGQLTGYSSPLYRPNTTALLSKDNTLYDLGAGTGLASFGFAINDFGQIGGFIQLYSNGDGDAMLWTPGVRNGTTGSMVDLGFSGSINAINSYGQLTGGYANGEHAFLWTPFAANGSAGQFTDLGVGLSGAKGAIGYGINTHGTIAGQSGDLEVQGTPDSAVYWTPTVLHGTTGTWRKLPVLPAYTYYGVANSIADNDDIVGTLGTKFDVNRAVLWHKKANGSYQAIDLNTRISAATGWVLTEALSINANGQILCTGAQNGGQPQTVLLSPK